MPRKLIIHPILFFSILAAAFPQQDTILYVPLKDTLKTADTSRTTSGVDAIVEYSAEDSAVFDLSGNKLLLYNGAEMKYKEFEVKAARVVLFKESSIMEAFGIPDTSDPSKLTGTPIFYEGSKRYDAERFRYNFRTKKGTITMGTTELEGGFYLGERIKKVDEDVLFVKRGRYTTCSKPDPDYYFGSPKMKVIQGENVIAEPVYLYVDDVPVFMFPLGVFPNHSGRSSGIIPPAYGEDLTYGRYLSHLGYFWAMNDYMDLALQGNYFTKGRIDLSMRYRYSLRYKFSGSLDVGGSRIRFGEETDIDNNFSDEWRIGISHSQSLDPTTSLTANVNLLSSKTYYNNSTNNLNDLLLQNAVSNITLSKTWEGTPNSLTLGYSRDQNLTTGEVSEVIPSAIFTRSQTFPFRSKSSSLTDLKWYDVISYAYSAQLLNRRTKTVPSDTAVNEDFTRDMRAGLRQVINITAPIIFSEFNLSPFANYTETWYNKYINKTFNPSDSSVVTEEFKGFNAFRFFNTGVSLSTRLVGIFKTGFLSVKGFRHTITPNVTYSYRPDFRKPFWNAYGSYTDAGGNQVYYSFYEKESFGTAPAGEEQNMSLSVGNVFEMKVKETDSTDNKFQILNVNAGINYNFVADSLKLSELGLSYRTEIGSLLDIGGGASFNFYKYLDGVGRINQFLLSSDKRLADLTSFNINLSTSFEGSQYESSDSVHGLQSMDDYLGIFSDKPVDFKIPWSVTLNYNYGFNRSNPAVIIKSSNISGSLSFSLTRNWKFTFSSGYDIFNREFTAPYITVYRDLHCWEMNFNWIPLGLYRGFRFELRIKAQMLQDLKITKQTSPRGVY